MHSSRAWRLLLSGHADGASNMAVDEAVLQHVGSESSPPTLRLYGWSPPCLSLGYNQPLDDADLDELHLLGWDIVRRPTGGRAILHTDELTYAIIAPANHPLVAGGVLESYRRLSRGLATGLRQLGCVLDHPEAQPPQTNDRSTPVCFEVPSAYEITHSGRKLVGSAQAQRRTAVLQHGSLPLGGDLARICRVLRFEGEAARQQAEARLRRRAVSLSAALGRQVTWDEAAEAIADGFEEALDLTLEPGQLTSAEADTMARLRAGHLAAPGHRQDAAKSRSGLDQVAM